MFDLVLSLVLITTPSDKAMASMKNNHCSQNMLLNEINQWQAYLISYLESTVFPYEILHVTLGI